MLPRDKEFVEFWESRRKKWSWSFHIKNTFKKIALPISLLIDLMNFFIIGDTEYLFFSFEHIFVFFKNLMLISAFIIFVSGMISWNMNEFKYWNILRKQRNNQ